MYTAAKPSHRKRPNRIIPVGQSYAIKWEGERSASVLHGVKGQRNHLDSDDRRAESITDAVSIWCQTLLEYFNLSSYYRLQANCQ